MSLDHKSYESSPLHQLVRQRQTLLSEFNQTLQERLYNIIYHQFNNCVKPTNHSTVDFPYGSVFNVEFTPQGQAVVAVHSNRAITLHDMRSEQQFSAVPLAHDDSCNVITFLDDNIFATGSDDMTVRLWDIRYCTKGSLSVLKGHKGWVKNVELDRVNGLLFSSAFNDGIRKWNINELDSYQSDECDNLVFDIRDAVRMRLAPDNSKMIVSVRKDHIYIISKFNGKTVSSIYNAFPHNLPITTDTLLASYSTNEHNVPQVHSIGPVENNRYRTPMCFIFHPSSQFIAMRVIDVKMQRLVQEISVLYRVSPVESQSNNKAVYSNKDTKSNFLKYCTESSPDEVLDYIKEISFSNDGRVLASPFDNSVRLLAVDVPLTPMEEYFDERFHSFEKSLNSLDFEEVAVCEGHKFPVLTCKFNSYNMCLVSGCVEGRVVFNWPKL